MVMRENLSVLSLLKLPRVPHSFLGKESPHRGLQGPATEGPRHLSHLPFPLPTTLSTPATQASFKFSAFSPASRPTRLLLSLPWNFPFPLL